MQENSEFFAIFRIKDRSYGTPVGLMGKGRCAMGRPLGYWIRDAKLWDARWAIG